MNDLLCSVIIPSYNRCTTLDIVLTALEHQTLPATAFETIVIVAGNDGGTERMLAERQRSARSPNLRWYRQNNMGQAVARNTGAYYARAPILIFMDDDVAPRPSLVEAHIRRHSKNERIAVLGDYYLPKEDGDTYCQDLIRSWWENTFDDRRLREQTPCYRDFCSGNFSIRRDDFFMIGGFDENFDGYGGEDYELGYRLLLSGVTFVVERDAGAVHHHRYTVAGLMRNAREEAHGDVLIGSKHPELSAGLLLMRPLEGAYNLIAWFAMGTPKLGDLLIGLIRQALPAFEKFGMQRFWLKCFECMRSYAYLRGLGDVLGTTRSLRIFQSGVLAISPQKNEVSYRSKSNPDNILTINGNPPEDTCMDRGYKS